MDSRHSRDSLLAQPSDWQAEEGRPISRVLIEPHDIFDPRPGGMLAPLYRLADRLHVRTRPSTVASHLLLAAGQPASLDRAKETTRNLRGMAIFDAVRVRSRDVGDSVEVRVQTRDAWTTTPEFSIERGGGQIFGSVRLAERNFLGRALRFGFAYREDPSGISRSIDMADPGVKGSHVGIGGYASEGSSGTAHHVEMVLPFYAQDAPYTMSGSATRSRTIARLYDQGVEAARFSRRMGEGEALAGFGQRHGRTVTRWTGSFFVLDRSFDENTPDPGAPPEFGGPAEQLRIRRFTVEGQYWRPNFQEKSKVEQLDGIEDFDLGPTIRLGVGFSPKALGSTYNEGYVSAKVHGGLDAGGAGFGLLDASYSTRLVSGPVEAVGRAEARWVNQSIRRHTFVVAAVGMAGWQPARDFQLIAGGLSGLRAHSIYALSGHEVIRLNAESRWALLNRYYELLSIGAAGFWDAAHIQGPGSGDRPWQHDLGFGLRIGFPRSTLNRVVRIDVAWQVSPPGASLNDAVISFGSSQAF